MSDMDLHLKVMHDTVSYARRSPNKTNPIAATIVCRRMHDGGDVLMQSTNYIPSSLKSFSLGQKVGNASPYLHAETALIIDTLNNPEISTLGASIYVTDPTCPNCAKNIIEAGISRVYIDKAGYEGEFASRRLEDFKRLAMPMYENAGVEVYDVDLVTQVVDLSEGFEKQVVRPDFSDVELEPYAGDVTRAAFSQFIEMKGHVQNTRVVFSLLSNNDVPFGYFSLQSASSVVFGDRGDMAYKSDKYTRVMEPLNKSMMTLARLGYTPERNFIFSAQVPTSREFVDAIGAGYHRYIIEDQTRARDAHGLKAMQQLLDAGVIEVLDL